MNKNRIEGRRAGTSWHHTAKSSGLGAEVNAAVARGSNAFLPGEVPRRKCRGKSAEAIVPSSEPDTQRPEDSMPGRAEPTSEHPTAGRTPEPMTPGWARHPVSAVLMGSMGCTVRGPRITQCAKRQLRAHCRNRRTRTRMSGGVGAGADPHGSVPATRLGVPVVWSKFIAHFEMKESLRLMGDSSIRLLVPQHQLFMLSERFVSGFGFSNQLRQRHLLERVDAENLQDLGQGKF